MASVIEKIAQLKAAQEKVEQLKTKINELLPEELAALPARYGFEKPDAFCKAVRDAITISGLATKAAAGNKKPAPRKQKTGNKGGARKKRAARQKRGIITEESRAKTIELLKAGSPIAKVAKMMGISASSVQIIKKAANLTGAKRGRPKRNTESASVPTPEAALIPVQAPVESSTPST